MIKKLSLYIFILITFLGMFDLGSTAHAAEPLGWCAITTDTSGLGGSSTYKNRVRTTPSGCKIKEGYKEGDWTPDSINDSFGICTITGPNNTTRKFQNLTETECSDQKPSSNGTWKWEKTWTGRPPQQGPIPEPPLGTCWYHKPGSTTVDLLREAEIPCRARDVINWKESTPEEYNAAVVANENKDSPIECSSEEVLKDGKCVAKDPKYYLLAPLPCEQGSSEGCVRNEDGSYTLNNFDPTQANGSGIGNYLNIMIRIFIGICAVLAVVMIVMGGLEWMTSGLASSKEAGKERIWGAVMGLLLALGSWLLLNTINPNLLKTDLGSLADVTVTVELEPETGIQGSGPEKKTITTVGGKVMTACDQSQMIGISLFGSNVQVHKGVASSLIRINTKWLAMPPQQRYKVNSVGGYNCRQVTGKPGFWSAHAFGVALDINPSTNPFGKKRITDMPPSFVQLFTSEGWGWGGNWSNVKDAMHFSKYPPAEGGNGVVEL